MKKVVLLLLIVFALASSPRSGFGDAFVMTKAVTASTIAEIFVAERTVRIELEIGASDLEAFRNILPDEVHAKLAKGNQPLQQRSREFFSRDFVLRAGSGDPLTGKVERLLVRRRVVRDEITGEPLAEQPDDAELVVYADLKYELNAQHPEKLSIRPPSRKDESTSPANIGFVAYHKGLPINDFRYLASEATLELNWDDPWYSRFQNRNLQRQNAAPISAYLYVEPFEVRKEIIVRPKDLQKFVDLGLDDSDMIPIDRQEELKKRIGQFLGEKNPVLIDGQAKPGHLDRIHFVRRTLRRTGVVDPPEELGVTSATLGVIYVYPIETLPQVVTMGWELFNDRIQQIPAAASDEAGPLPTTLTPQDPVLRWQNFLTNPTVPTFANIAPPPSPAQVPIPMVSLLCAVALVPLGITVFQSYKQADRVPGRVSLICVALIVVAVVTFPHARLAVANPFARQRQMSDAEASEILTGLIHNVYRAFDRRDQSLIYDQLSRSIAGDLLEQVYLETRKTIEIENQGGLQIKVNDVAILDLQRISTSESNLTFRCHWRVAGSVGHWGHVHTRVNEPSARITLAVDEGAWKIITMEMINEPIAELEE